MWDSWQVPWLEYESKFIEKLQRVLPGPGIRALGSALLEGGGFWERQMR